MDAERFRPVDVGRVIDDAVVLYRADVKAYLGMALLVLLPPMLLSSVATSLYYTGMADLIGIVGQAGELGQPSEDGLFAMFGLFPLVVAFISFAGIIQWVARQVVLGASYMSTPGALRGRLVERASGLLGAARSRYVMLLVVAFLVSTVVQFGLVALIIPGVFIAVRLAVAGPVTVIEGGGIDTAFGRSWKLTSGYWWRTFLFWGGLALVSGVVRSAIAAPAVFLVGRTILPALQGTGAVAGGDALWASVVVGVATAVGSAIVVPFEGLAWGRYYLDLRARREAMDLVMEAAELREERA